ncbi:MAG: hypothetical protein IJS09_04525 [Treponema sp.]|nr:hypothetical protein [Treponema sp.]
MKQKKIRLLLSLVFLPAAFFARAKEYTFGLYITDLYNFDQVAETFQADVWLWSNYFGDEVDFNGTLDFINSIDEREKNYSSVHDAVLNRNYMQQKCTGTFRCEWDLRRFPFDENTLVIQIEDYRPIDDVRFVPDYHNSKISDAILLDEWELSSLYMYTQAVTYDSNFGDLSSQSDRGIYSRIIASVSIARKTPWITFFKLTFGVYIAFVLSVVSLAIRPETDSRLSLPCAALFAVVSNKYVVESVVPSSISLTILDSIHIVTMVCILLICMVIIQTDGMRRSCDQNKIRRSFMIDRIFVSVMTVVYVAFNLWVMLE